MCVQGPDIYEKVKSDVGSMQETLKTMDFIGPRAHQRIRDMIYHDLPALLKEHSALQKRLYAPAEYEYAMQITYRGREQTIYPRDWCALDVATERVERYTKIWELNGNHTRYVSKLVKRRKAGPVEDA